ncbi:hypothetical protein BH09PAT4_BH09PAT4_06450 [soil metagenome]
MRKPQKKRKIKPTKSMKPSKRVTRIRFAKRYPVILAVVILVALVGLYLLIRSSAYYNPGEPGTVYFDNPDNMKSHSVGTAFSLTMYGHVPNPSASENPTGKLHVNIDFDSYSNSGYKRVHCGSAGTCHPGTGHTASSPWHDNFARCIDITPSYFGNTMAPLLVINFVSVQDGAYNLGAQVQWTGGTCANPGGYSGSYTGIGWLLGQCGPTGLGAPCSGAGGGGGGGGAGGGGGGGQGGGGAGGAGGGAGGGGAGRATGAGGNGGGGATTTGSTSGSGGAGSSGGGSTSSTGSSGSSATRQASKPNRVTTTTSQGTKKQSAVTQPSPFYDGKLFAAGSDPVEQSGGPIKLVRQITPRQWSYGGVSLVLLGGAVGYFFWSRRRSRRY